jgi:hypothetical protein
VKTIRFSHLLVMIVITVILCGCSRSALKWKQDIEVPRIESRGQSYNEVIVSGFYSSERVTSVTSSLEIRTIMESVNVYDMSP